VSLAAGDVIEVAAKALPDMLTDATLVLHSNAAPLLDGCYCAQVSAWGMRGAWFEGRACVPEGGRRARGCVSFSVVAVWRGEVRVQGVTRCMWLI
jgi:hypothetical protein